MPFNDDPSSPLLAPSGAPPSEEGVSTSHLKKVDKEVRVPISLDEFSADCSATQELSVRLPNKTMTFSVKVNKEIPSAASSAIGTRSSMTDRLAKDVYIFGDHSNGSSINVIRKGSGQIIGSVIDVEQDVVLQIRIDSEGNNFVQVSRSVDFPPEADPVDELLSIDEMTTERSLGHNLFTSSTHEPVQRNAQAEPTTIDVMVLWTRKAECANAGPVCKNGAVNQTTAELMEDLIQLAIQETNTAYQLSGVDIQLELVYRYRSDYVEPSSNAFSISLGDLKGQTDGNMDEVHALRSTYGADLVALIIEDPAYCGIGKQNDRASFTFSLAQNHLRFHPTLFSDFARTSPIIYMKDTSVQELILCLV